MHSNRETVNRGFDKKPDPEGRGAMPMSTSGHLRLLASK
jgi:hypothetical protein